MRRGSAPLGDCSWALAGRAVGGRTARAVARSAGLLALAGSGDGGYGARAGLLCLEPGGTLRETIYLPSRPGV